MTNYNKIGCMSAWGLQISDFLIVLIGLYHLIVGMLIFGMEYNILAIIIANYEKKLNI